MFLGIALNLEEDSVGCVSLVRQVLLKKVMRSEQQANSYQSLSGKDLFGRVVDAVGRPIDEKGPIDSDISYPVERIAPGIIPRKSVTQPLQTGIMAVDSMIPIGEDKES